MLFSMKKNMLFALLLGAVVTTTHAQIKDIGLHAIGTPHNPKVQMAWNRYYDYAQITDFCRRLQAAYPDLVKIESIGKSVQGKDIWVLTITDFKTGQPETKPGFYADANIHSNELQGSEMLMYKAWYLVESFASVKFVKELLADKTFYILPTLNPDARDHFINELNTLNSPRSGLIPVDDDGDGQIDEDSFDDLNGDGEITFMRRKSPYGRLKVDPNDPHRMIPAKPDELGEYEMLGYEGLDNDGDGQVNEDRPGSYDPNRDWGWNWQPDYIQGGALKYPFSLPETRAVMEFVMKHPNIAGAQSYHNFGGMFLRGPGAEEDATYYNQQDVGVYDVIGKLGEKLIPGYNYFILYKDLYTVYGGEIDWLSTGRGIFTFSNELMTNYMLFNAKPNSEGRGQDNQVYEADKYLLFGDAFVEWTPYKHPQYGDIEVGGFKKNYVRNHPGFLLEYDGHRNLAFTMYHAYQMPKLSVPKVVKQSLGNGFTQITATVLNARIIPTHSSHDLKYKIERPDYITLKGAEVVAGLAMENLDFNMGREQKTNPATIEVLNIPGMGVVHVRWVVRGNPSNYTVEVNSRKGGVVTASGGF
jgi:Zinc carboxypeptidase